MAPPASMATRLVVPRLFSVQVVSTEEFLNQKPGQLGLFLPRTQFQRKHFVENYVQSVFDALGTKLPGSTLVIGTDGSPLAVSLTRLILRLAAGNGVGRVVVGVGARLSAPALSIIMRRHESGVVGGFFMSGDGGGGGREEANTNAGNEAKDDEEEEDVNANGIIGGERGGKVAEAAAKEDKFAFQTFVGNGGLACEDFNDIIFKKTRYITKYRLVNDFPPKLFETPGLRETFIEGRSFFLEVVDPLESYVECLQDFFDFELLRLWAMRFPKRMVIGVGGGQMEIYAKKIFGELLGMNAFGFVECQGAWKDVDQIGDVTEIYKKLRLDEWDFGISLSPDGRRCCFFCADGRVINPGSILALVAERSRFFPGLQPPKVAASVTGAAVTDVAATEAAATEAAATEAAATEAAANTNADNATNASASTIIPKLPKGFARTVFATRAVDLVAAKRGVEIHVTPAEWRHVGALLDAGRVAIFGDDAFQMGSYHARVPDGIWSALAVMTVFAVAEAEDGGAKVEEEEEEEKVEQEKQKSSKEEEKQSKLSSSSSPGASADSSSKVEAESTTSSKKQRKRSSSRRATPTSTPKLEVPTTRSLATQFYLSLMHQQGGPIDALGRVGRIAVGNGASATRVGNGASTTRVGNGASATLVGTGVNTIVGGPTASSIVIPPARIFDPLRRTLERHWEEFGRHFSQRLDYESLKPEVALEMFESLQMKIRSPIIFAHAWFHHGPMSYQVIRGEEFQYFDPINISSTLTTNCIRIFLHEGSIITFRLCSTEDGLNFRISVDKHEDSVFKVKYSRKTTLQPLINIAQEMCGIVDKTGKTQPDSLM